MKVTAVKAIPVSVPAETAYETSIPLVSGAEHKFDHVLVQIETDAGVTGLGESAPLSSWPHGLSQGAVNSLIKETLAPVVEGRRIEHIPRIIDDCSETLPGEPFPLCGIDMALWDALGKARDLPVYDLLGGPVNEIHSIDLHYTISIKEPKKIQVDVKNATEAGYSAIKIKVGGPDFATEREAIAAIAEVAPDTNIRIDANQGWTVPEALRRIPILNEAAGGLVLVEQPIDYDNIAGMSRLRESVAPPILADEACFGPRSVAMLARADACDIVNVKLGKAGGLSRASDVATVADAHGLPCFMGGMFELGVGAAANAHFAASCPNITYPTGALHVHAADALVQERAQWTPDTGTFTIPDSAGLGVTLDMDAVAEYRVD